MPKFGDSKLPITVSKITVEELAKLNQKFNPTFLLNSLNNHIILSTTNVQVNQTNATKLDELGTDLKVFEGEITGKFPKDIYGNFILPTEQNLHLKVGAQIMILKNDSGEFKRYFNGKIGKISSLDDKRIIVEFSDQSKVQIEKASWNNIEYIWNKEKKKIEEQIIGTFTQYPIRLAWAITVHKSQGLTFEKVYADLGAAFTDGQVYVALSRCTTLSGLVLKTKIPLSKITTNEKALEFAKTETPSTLIVQELNSGKADYYYKQAREAFRKFDIESAFQFFLQATKFRNDIETDNFNRYVSIWAKRLFISKNFADSFTKEIIEIKGKFNQMQNDIVSNVNVIKQKEEKIIELNNAVKLLLDKTQEIENEKNNLSDELIKCKSDSHLMDSKIQILEKNIIEQNSKIKDLETKNSRLYREIIRLRNIKWFQRLFGKV